MKATTEKLLKQVRGELAAERDRIDKAIIALDNAFLEKPKRKRKVVKKSATTKKTKRRKWTKAEREAISRRMKKAWRKRKSEK
jgi:hypothetical protein